MAGKAPKKKTTTPPPTDASPIDRALPCNLDAERGVIGAILLDPNLCDDVATIVRPNDFYLDKHRRIYRALTEMNATSHVIDLTLLVEQLRSTNELEEVGGEAYLAELMQSVQVTAHATHYANIVSQNAIRRSLIGAAEDILVKAYSPEFQPRELVAAAEEKIFAVNDERSSNSLKSMRDLMEDVFELVDKRASGENDAVDTGFLDLNKVLGGFHPSELIIIAARPSMGKTAFATNIADFVAVEKDIPVLFFSLEMAKTELALRMICARGRIRGQSFRNSLSEQDSEKFHRAAAALASAPLYIDDTPSRTVAEIGAIARRLKRQVGLGLVIIDYLGLIEPDNSLDPRQEQVAKIARRLKGLARELQVPVVCLSQLNRMTEQSKDSRPRLNHLRESGAIEQDADVVMFVHREEYYLTEEQAEEKNLKGVAEIIVAKQRNGPIGDVKLAWRSEYTLFTGLARVDESELYYEQQQELDEFQKFSGNDGYGGGGTSFEF